tara:strand:+ start:1370 stop:1651 length:282 start_codon:yes stop_codon:yes gene_type:complete
MGHDKSGKGHIQHCGPAHQKSEPGAPKILGAIAAKVLPTLISGAMSKKAEAAGMYSKGVNMMGGCQISKHMSSNRYFNDMPIVSDQNPDKKGA